MSALYWATSGPGKHQTRQHAESGNLPNLVGKAKSAQPIRPFSQGTGENFWNVVSTDAAVYTKARPTFRNSQMSSTGTAFRSPHGTPLATAQQSAATLMQSIEDELELQGLYASPPSLERVRVFSSAFSELIDKLPSYRVLLLAIQKEYDGFLGRLHAQLNAAAPAEARLKTVKAASLSYVGESMAWFQIEVSDLKKKNADSDAEIARLNSELEKEKEKRLELENTSDTSRFMAKESHSQNLDILKHMDRMEKQVELLRKQEREAQGQMNVLSQRVKEKECRIESVEKQLEAERNKVLTMVPQEEMNGVMDECRALEQRLEELEVRLQSKHRDYMSIVEAYTKVSGQVVDDLETRPLTPRPDWVHCKGLLDPDYRHTVDKASQSQELLQHMLACSRTLLSAYGLSLAAQKSQVIAKYAKHPLTLQLASTPEECKLLNRSFDGNVEEEKEMDALIKRTQLTESRRATAMLGAGGHWLEPDLEADTPHVFQHSEPVKNLRFSRWRVSDFFEQLLLARVKLHETRSGAGMAPNPLSKTFCQFMLEHIPEDVDEEEKTTFAINMFATLRRYSAEPEFLGYFLLVKDKIPDGVVRDNKHMCSEVLKLFSTSLIDATEGSRHITKQRFFYGLREVMPNKEKDMWQDLVTYFPAGGAELLVNFEWLLFDDLYVLSPIVYALRLQHLEEAVNLSERLEKVVRGCLDPEGKGTVTYSAIEDAFSSDPDFSLIHPEDRARAFDSHKLDVKPEMKQDVGRFLELVKHSDIFHVLYFPALASEIGEGLEEDG